MRARHQGAASRPDLVPRLRLAHRLDEGLAQGLVTALINDLAGEEEARLVLDDYHVIGSPSGVIPVIRLVTLAAILANASGAAGAWTNVWRASRLSGSGQGHPPVADDAPP